MSKTLLQEFTRVNRRSPCPICGRSDWCMIALDGWTALCQRVESDRRFGSAGWAHLLTRRMDPPPPVETNQLPAAVVERLVMGWLGDMTREHAHRLSRALNVSIRSLDRLNVGWNADKGCYTFPMRNAAFEYTGVRFRTLDGRKWALKGGADGLFLPLSSVGGDRLFITEGPTDCAAILDCGFMAVGRPSNLSGVDDVAELVARFRPRAVVVVCDHDPGGTDAARNTAHGREQLREALSALPRPPRLKMIRPARAKDARACVASGGRRRAIIEVLNGNRNFYWELLPCSKT